ncbi:hypothetical protein BpHYR1_025087 [Brachionus plicatilis]|uniref:Uncharacterized protein n=1 Tax=Brachionus plicatilis TaxID=10195 RepID=A0A3M7RGK8_BRAPC|nr:hypothetical protein BpHYR1_025087 [Brachionus plicatilis]
MRILNINFNFNLFFSYQLLDMSCQTKKFTVSSRGAPWFYLLKYQRVCKEKNVFYEKEVK